MRYATLFLLAVGASSSAPLSAQGTMARTVPDSVRARLTGKVSGDSFSVIYSTAPRGRARIGVMLSLAPGADDRYGALVESVIPKGPADVAGVRAGDIITKVNDVAIGTASTNTSSNGLSVVGERLIAELSSLQPGKVATLQLRRGNATLAVKVTPDRDDTVVATTILSPRGMDAAVANSFIQFQRDTTLRLKLDSLGGFLRFRTESLTRSLGGMIDLTTSLRGMAQLDSSRVNGTLSIRRKDPVTGVMQDSTITFGRAMPSMVRRGDIATMTLPGASGAARLGELMSTLDSSNKRLTESRAMANNSLAATDRMRGLQLSPDSVGGLFERNVVLLRSSFDALSRLELAPVNKELGSYFGTNEGVLVISISPPGVLVVDGMAVPSRQRVGVAVGKPSQSPARAAASPKTSDDMATVLSLKPGDIITAVDGRAVTTPSQLMRILRSYEANDGVKLTVVRQKKVITIQGKMPSE